MSNTPKNQEKFNSAESPPVSQGNFLPELRADPANLREFGHQVSVIRELEMKGKMSRFESSQEIKRLWNQLQA